MTSPDQAQPSAVRTLARERHHARARAVAEGRPPEGPQHIVEILLGDPAFQNLVAVYKRELLAGVAK